MEKSNDHDFYQKHAEPKLQTRGHPPRDLIV